MKRTQHNQRGFSVVELTLILVIAAALAGVGYYVYQQRRQASKDTGAQATTQPSDVTSAPAINNTSDLDKASKVLDQTDIDGSNASDSTALNTQSSF